MLCKKLELFGGELIAIDGSKFSAVNHNKRTYTKDGLRLMIKEIDEKISKYLSRLEDEDQKEAGVVSKSGKELQEQIQKLHEHRANLQQIQEELEESGEAQISLTDPDSRKMQTSQHGIDVSYNVQIAVDDKHKLILDVDVTNDNNDRKQLYRMAKRSKEILEVERLDIVADMGYHNKQEIKKCEGEQIHCYISEPVKSENERLGYYAINEFQYNSQEDYYICPAKQKLTYRGKYFKEKLECKEYASRTCKGCRLRTKCIHGIKDRRIYRWVGEESIDEMRRRMYKNLWKVKKRKELVEHPFGTIKHWMNQGYFLMRGFAKVMGEMSLSVLAYNMKRVINIIGVKKLITAIKVLKRQVVMSDFEHFVFLSEPLLTQSVYSFE